MKKQHILFLMSGLLFTQALFSSSFMPYADITINTHWSQETQRMDPMDLATIAKNNGIKGIRLAFITDSGHCNPAWGSQADYSLDKNWGTRLTDQLARDGLDISVSFGGASGNDLSLYCDKNQLIAIFNKVVKTYKAKSLDFDIENSSVNVLKLMQALEKFQQENPTIKLILTLPVLPEGLTASGKEVISLAKTQGLNFNVNIMAMDYGESYTGNMGHYAIQAATSLHRDLEEFYPIKSSKEIWAMIELTPMIGVNDVQTEQFTLKDADALRCFAKNNGIGGLSMWSLGRDKPCSAKWASPHCSGNNLQSKDYEFVEHLR